MNTVKLREVEALLSGESRARRLPEAIEAAYLSEVHETRSQVMRLSAVPMAIIYNAFLVADFFLVPETFGVAALIHLCLVTPVILVMGLSYGRLRSQWLQNLASVISPVLMVAQIMTIFRMNSGVGAEHYQYLAILVIANMNIVMRGEFRAALLGSGAIVVIYLSVLLGSDATPYAKSVGMFLMVSIAHITLVSNHWAWRGSRETFLRQLRDRLQREGAENRAQQDPLTGIANRNRLEILADGIWRQGDDGNSPVAVIMIDIDHFKAYNDRFGHPVGDECLKRVAFLLSDHVDGKELVARYGGEEFIVVLPATELSDAVRRAEQMRRAISDLAIPHPGAGIGGIVTASFGAMSGPVSRYSIAQLTSSADSALYAAKRAGRNTVWPRPFGSEGDTVVTLPVGRPIT